MASLTSSFLASYGMAPDNTTIAHVDREPGETDFDRLPPALRGENTHMIYIAPNGKVFNLAGPGRGRQGVRLAKSLLGDQNWPFQLLYTEFPYLQGAQIERVNVRARMFSLGIIIGNHAPPMTEYQFRMAEDNWWGGQDENKDGWVGFYTRYTGWRFVPVRPDNTVITPTSMDSTAYGNNAAQYDLTWIGARPWFTKPALYRTWKARESGPPVTSGGLFDTPVYTGTLPIANRGDLPSYVTYLVSSPGEAAVQDNNSDRMVPLPYTSKQDGTYMCDTEPGHRTLTATTDPVDNIFYKIARASKVLDFLLHDLTSLGLPLQLRFNRRFMFAIPPRTEVTFGVQHTNPNAQITAFVPQRFKRSR